MLDVLIALQKARGLEDGPFAKSIGVTREHWNRLRHGRPNHTLTPKIVQNARRSYPEIREAADIFLLGDDRKLSTTLAKAPSNIDAEASEATRTLVLTKTLACRETETALPGQGEGGLVVRSVPRSAGKSYVTPLAHASAQASRAADAEAG